MKSARDIVALMLDNDAFSHWLGIEIVHIEPGSCTLKAVVTNDMLNGFSIAHGGITYSLADSALAFASNSRGPKCVSIETSISHIRPTKTGDELRATARELHRSKKIGIYDVTVINQEDKPVALFKGTVHISENNW